MKTFFRDNGLTVALAAMFLFSALGMMWSGHTAYNQELREHGAEAVGLVAYMTSGNFLSARSRTGRASSCRCRPM